MSHQRSMKPFFAHSKHRCSGGSRAVKKTFKKSNIYSKGRQVTKRGPKLNALQMFAKSIEMPDGISQNWEFPTVTFYQSFVREKYQRNMVMIGKVRKCVASEYQSSSEGVAFAILSFALSNQSSSTMTKWSVWPWYHSCFRIEASFCQNNALFNYPSLGSSMSCHQAYDPQPDPSMKRPLTSSFIRLASAVRFSKSKYSVNWRNAICSSAPRTSAWDGTALRQIAAMTSGEWDQPCRCGTWSRCLAARQGERLQGSLIPAPFPLTPEAGKFPSRYLYESCTRHFFTCINVMSVHSHLTKKFSNVCVL
jgi:hypothetical protein